MDPLDDDALDTAEEDKKKKKKGESDSVDRENVEVTAEFYAHMASIGASKNLVAEILRSWRHLRGDALVRALQNFAGKLGFTRATAHAQVDIGKEKNFGLLHNLVQFFRREPQQKPTVQQKFSSQNKPEPK
ncbi:MAG: hypothetical protein FWF24_00595 [Alphaproteobacteria bacterium]|nr:hypothetical protein [Alphaproteobacteria bacterium]